MQSIRGARGRALIRLAPLAALIGLLLLPGSVLAHERRGIGNGQYNVTVGWDVEPAYVGLKNAASIRIADTDNKPVVGADKTLKVQIRQGASTKEFPLRAVFGQDGYYVADLIPTRDGDYQWTFVGTIGDQQINEKFDTADGKFDAVQPQAALQFPVSQPDPAQTSSAVQAAQADASTARTLAYVGIALGVLGIVAAAGAWFTRPRTTTPARVGAPQRDTA
ncbi:MAG: hypothetical protein JOZ81_23560 [Chloroflexi bacterium]|nr:hypothetical protein [Chloroflexota bacterium]